jgi:hypothetical protein
VRDVDRTASTVTIDAWGENQRGQRTCDARLVVVLAASDGVPATIPAYDESQVPEATAP